MPILAEGGRGRLWLTAVRRFFYYFDDGVGVMSTILCCGNVDFSREENRQEAQVSERENRDTKGGYKHLRQKIKNIPRTPT